MKDRLLTLLLALGAFLAFYGYFIGPNEEAAERSSRPISTEARGNGYFALRHWLETQGVPVTELRHRYDWLEETSGLPPRGNLLITTVPHKRPTRQAEESALVEWVRRGNTVLVLAGVFDTPEWGVPDFTTPGEFHKLSGLWVMDHEPPDEDEAAETEGAGKPGTRAQAEDEAEAEAVTGLSSMFNRLPKPKRSVMQPVGEHPLTRGVTEVHAVSEYDAGKFDVASPPREPALALLNDGESGLAAFWVTWNGEGRVMASGFASILTNKMLAEGGNATLAANIVAAAVGPGGHVIFDDMHQGASSVYDAQAFFGDPRLHATFWWIMALWLLWVIGSSRLPPPAARPAAVRERGFVQATGNFFARVLGRKRTAGRLFANFFNDCHRAANEPADGSPAWGWIRGFGAVPREEIDRLEKLHARVAAGRRVDLVDLHNRLHHLRKQLT